MATLAVEALATANADSVYNQDKWYLPSPLIRKRTDLGTPFIGPVTVSVARPKESVNAYGISYPCAINWSKDINWIFCADSTIASLNKIVTLWEHNKAVSTMTYKGYIRIRFPLNVGAKIVRGFQVTYDKYTTGTAQVANGDSKVGGLGSAGGTTWVASRLAWGCRIGFGDTRPWMIEPTNWHTITNIVGDTKLAISPKATSEHLLGPYVIEDVRMYFQITNATTGAGGLFVSKGVSYGMFNTLGDSIPQYNNYGDTLDIAVRQDNRRRTYWLLSPTKIELYPVVGVIGNSADSIGAGLALEPKTSWTSQFCYTLDANAGGQYRMYKHNVRATLVLSKLGADSRAAYVCQTQNAVLPLGTILQLNNLRYAVANHGPGRGAPSLYFLTTGANGRIFRAATNNITSFNQSWINDTMNEQPPGTTNTFPATALLSGIDYSDVIDRFIITSTGAAGVRSYVTQYRADGGQIDHIFLVEDKQIDQGIVSTDVPLHPSINILGKSIWTEGGFLYLVGVGATITTNIMHAIPLGADWSYTTYTGNRLISPRLLTPNCDNYNRVYVVRDRIIGSDVLGLPADPFRLWYRTVGITNNTGTWSLVPEPNDLSSICGGDEGAIQFAFDFKTISQTCIPSRVFLLGVTYTDYSTDAHYQPSVGLSDKTYKRFAWRFATAFGSTVPTLRVRLYEATSGTLLLNDTTAASTYGVWAKSTNNGTTWGAYNTTDKVSDSIYIRYTPTTLADNIKVRPLLSI
jgi:hypothetical protein